MTDLTDRWATLTQAAEGAGVSREKIRHWTNRGQLSLSAYEHHDEGKWRKYSVLDVCALSFVGECSKFHVPPEESCLIYWTALDTVKLRGGLDGDMANLIDNARDVEVFVWPAAGGWDWAVGTSDKTPTLPATHLRIHLGITIAMVVERWAAMLRRERSK